MVFGSKLGQDSMLTDDDSFEEQFQGEVLINVTAPAGKLRMLMDAPAGGVPVIHVRKQVSSPHKFKSANDSCPWIARIAPF
jgi:hypothetical protein